MLQTHNRPGALERWACLTYRYRWLMIAVALMLVVLGGVWGAGVAGSLKAGGYTDPASESSRADATLPATLGQPSSTLLVLFTAQPGQNVDDPAVQSEVEAVLQRLDSRPGTGTVRSYYSTGAAQFVSLDRRSTYATIALLGDDTAQLKTVEELRPLLSDPHLQVQLGGWPAVTEEMTRQVSQDLQTAEGATFPLVAVLLVLIFGGLTAASLPLAVGTVTILCAFVLVRLVAGVTDVSLFALNIITMFGLGLAIDYSLLVVSRFREELAASDGQVPLALERTLSTAGRTVLFSGLTVAISLLSLLLFAPTFLRSLGLGGTLAVLVAMTSALTVLPALLAILGSRVNSLAVHLPRRGRITDTPAARVSFWQRANAVLMRHPGLVCGLTLVPLLLLGTPFLHITFGLPDARSLPAGHESRRVADRLATDFAPNETQPLLVVLQTPGPVLAGQNLAALGGYTTRLAALPGVRRVDSLAAAAATSADPSAAAAKLAPLFGVDTTTVVSVVYDGDPDGPQAQALVRQVRAAPRPAGFQAQVTGWPAYRVDLLDSLGHSLPLAATFIVASMFVLLFLMLGSLVVPAKAVVLNVLSLSVSFGALVWIFQDGHLAGWLGASYTGSIDTTQPVLVFAAAFGLSMDYEVFLLSRIKEHYDRSGDMSAAINQGLQRTGAIITSAALLLVVVFGGFVRGDVLLIKETGVGLAVAILVDATVVRLLLLPATMRLLGRYNWWAPAPLLALQRRVALRA